MRKTKKLKVRVYIDGANMFYTQKKLGWFFAWRKIRTYLKRNYEIRALKFYTGKKRRDKNQKKLLDKLQQLGFQVVTKPLKRVNVAGFGEKPVWQYKANFDVELAIEAIWETYFDQETQAVVIFSGDSDFAFLVKFVKRELGRKVFIFSTKGMIAWELKLLASKVYYLERLKRKIFLKNWDLTKTERGGKIKIA